MYIVFVHTYNICHRHKYPELSDGERKKKRKFVGVTANSGCNKTNQKTSGVKTCIVHRCRYCTTRWTGPSRLCAPIRRRTVETNAVTASLVRSFRWRFHYYVYIYIYILSGRRCVRYILNLTYRSVMSVVLYRFPFFIFYSIIDFIIIVVSVCLRFSYILYVL